MLLQSTQLRCATVFRQPSPSTATRNLAARSAARRKTQLASAATERTDRSPRSPVVGLCGPGGAGAGAAATLPGPCLSVGTRYSGGGACGRQDGCSGLNSGRIGGGRLFRVEIRSFRRRRRPGYLGARKEGRCRKQAMRTGDSGSRAACLHCGGSDGHALSLSLSLT